MCQSFWRVFACRANRKKNRRKFKSSQECDLLENEANCVAVKFSLWVCVSVRVYCGKMRFVDCPNCFLSHSDESEFSDVSASSGRKRFRALTKIIFNRQKKSAKFYNNVNIEKHPNGHWPPASTRKFAIERKHKVKKRDLLRQLLGQSGNFCANNNWLRGRCNQ